MSTQKYSINQTLEDSIANALILPNITSSTRVLEIGCRQGRWTKYFADALELIATDSDQNNIDFCQQQFFSFPHFQIKLQKNSDLSYISKESIDFLWSFDTFINFSADTTLAYLSEISRILSPHGKCIIHHPGRNNFALKFQKLTSLGIFGRKLYQAISLQKYTGDDGQRSQISPEVFSSLALKTNLVVEAHIFSWGKFKQFSLKPFNDCLSVVSRNSKLIRPKF